jgi:hypothetical protein
LAIVRQTLYSRPDWRPSISPEPSYLSLYVQQVSQAVEGADFSFIAAAPWRRHPSQFTLSMAHSAARRLLRRVISGAEMGLRFAIDTGGTFTDLMVATEEGVLTMHKAPTTPSDPVAGVIDSLRIAAEAAGEDLGAFLGRGEILVHGTTHAINAIVTGSTARTAFLTTQGHPDTLVFREGGRIEPFNFTVPYTEPYVPRALTYEVPERITVSGAIKMPLDEDAVVAILAKVKAARVEAIGVSFLWSMVNPAHEIAVGALIAKHLPGVPYTLSHEVNPSIREYRRASSTCIDASLKPVIGAYMRGLEKRLRDAGFRRSASPPDQFRPQHGAGRRQGLWRWRRRRDADRRRCRRHHFRRLAGAARPHSEDPRNLARPAFPQPHDRHALR